MALWGQILKPNQKLRYEVPDEASLIVNQAVLPKECKGNVSVWISGFMDEEGAMSEAICVAQLNWAAYPQVNFEVLIPNGDNVELEVRGDSEVHLLGYFSPIEMDDEEDGEDEDDDDISEDSAELARLIYGLEDEDADSDDAMDADSDDEDEDEAPRKSARIEELPSDEETAQPQQKKAAAAPVTMQPPAKKQKTSETTSKATAAAPKAQNTSSPVSKAAAVPPQSPQAGDAKKKRKRNKNKGTTPQ